jgi:CXXX repeat peptide maturase
MDKIDHMWVLLSNQSTVFCHEQQDPKAAVQKRITMDPEVFMAIIKQAEKYNWTCSIVTDKKGIVEDQHKKLRQINHRLIIPADYEGGSLGEETVIVYNSEQARITNGLCKGKAILRINQEALSELASLVINLLESYGDVSIRHPDLLRYTQEDFKTYQIQLHEVAEWLLNKGDTWPEYRVDVLMEGFTLEEFQECGAGNTSLAVGPDGCLYICPAAFQAEWRSCGHISKDLNIPNRHLFTRHYALPCRDKCHAVHCARCVFINKQVTFEYCVPAKTVCQLKHIELNSQVWLAKKAIKQGTWNNSWRVPRISIIDDPYVLVKSEEDVPPTLWRRLHLFKGCLNDLSPSMMLDIILNLRGRAEAILSGIQSGYYIPPALTDKNTLLYLRRKTVGRYKDVVFDKRCPSVYEIELLMQRLVETIANDNEDYASEERNNIYQKI